MLDVFSTSGMLGDQRQRFLRSNVEGSGQARRGNCRALVPVVPVGLGGYAIIISFVRGAVEQTEQSADRAFLFSWRFGRCGFGRCFGLRRWFFLFVTGRRFGWLLLFLVGRVLGCRPAGMTRRPLDCSPEGTLSAHSFAGWWWGRIFAAQDDDLDGPQVLEENIVSLLDLVSRHYDILADCLKNLQNLNNAYPNSTHERSNLFPRNCHQLASSPSV